MKCVDRDCVGIFPLLWTPPNQLISTVKCLPRRWDVHLNWSLMFTHHFPVGSDSLRLSSAHSSFGRADTSRLTYPHEADVFSCWSHSIPITWECAMVRFIYLFFQMLPARISSWDTCVIFEDGPRGTTAPGFLGCLKLSRLTKCNLVVALLQNSLDTKFRSSLLCIKQCEL